MLVGDKHLMFSATGKAFVMFGRQGRSWISLFDPANPVPIDALIETADSEMYQQKRAKRVTVQDPADAEPSPLVN